MTPELATFIDELQGPKCVTTQKGEARLCKRCGEEFTPTKFHPKQRYCSRHCQNNTARKVESELIAEIKNVAKMMAYRYLTRDRSIGFDGRYEGPMNKSVTCVVGLQKDTGYHAMPIDVHVKPIEPKFTQVTPEDVDWGMRQGRPAKHMPRKHENYCALCVEVVIDQAKNQVRAKKGVYLPIEHQCNSVRVYNLQGVLLETKQL